MLLLVQYYDQQLYISFKYQSCLHVLYLKGADINTSSLHSKERRRGTPGEEWLNYVPCVNYRAQGQNSSIMRSGERV